jgi:uncharacterized cupin superfamily protein
MSDCPTAVDAAVVAPRVRRSNYPEPFASRMSRREKRPLGDIFGITSSGVNLTRLAPDGVSALHHCHTRRLASCVASAKKSHARLGSGA